MSDISNVLHGYGVQLESKAVDTFGAAVGDYARQAGLGPLSDVAMSSVLNGQPTINTVGGVLDLFGLNSVDDLLGNKNVWQSSKYAADLIAYAPKHRFIFKVKFVFNSAYANINREFMYVVKQIDKPKVTFEYEDVNMYNYHTKVLKSIRHEPLQMIFHDDIQNKVLEFFNAYRTAYSPISTMGPGQVAMFENAGMDFYEPGTEGRNSASMGLLEDDNKTVLKYIEVIQVYGHGTRQNSFFFINPRIENFDFDNLDHEHSDGNALSVSFNYDALYISGGVTPQGTPAPAWGQSDILGNTERAGGKTIGNGMGEPNFSKSQLPDSVTGIFPQGSGFPNLAGGAISSVMSIADSAKSTLSKVMPSINQAQAGVKNLFSGFGIG
jgi:hypothetical protein